MKHLTTALLIILGGILLGLGMDYALTHTPHLTWTQYGLICTALAICGVGITIKEIRNPEDDMEEIETW